MCGSPSLSPSLLPLSLGRDADRDAEGCGVGQDFVEDGPALLGPELFVQAPAVADRGGGGGGVHGGAERVGEALVGVGREVDDLAGAGCERSGDLDVEEDLPVYAVRVALRVVAAFADADRRHAGSRCDAEV
ncbi:hypothetical protein ACFQ1I_46730 [Kitasatospora arboriphila]